MKKLIALLLASVMILSLAAACGSSNQTSTTPSTPSTPSTTPSTPSTTTPSTPATPTEPDPEPFTGEHYGGDLTIGTSNALTTMDLFFANGGMANLQWSCYVYQALCVLDANGRIYSDLCDYEASEDGLTYTFTLRENYFTNGEKVTMDDVEASLRRNIALYCKSMDAFNKNFKDATFTFSPDKLVVTFPSFNINFASAMSAALTQYRVMPKSICDKHPITGGETTENGFVINADSEPINEIDEVIGSGPYMLEEYDETHVKLVRNPNYKIITDGNEDAIGWGAPKMCYPDSITLSINTDAASRTAAMMAHEYDVAGITASMKDAVLGMGIVPFDAGTTWTHGIFFNLNTEKRPNGILNDVNLRKAIRAAIDCNAVLLGVLAGDQSRVVLDPYAVRKETVYYSTKMEDSGEWNIHDMDKAREYLAQSNYNGEPIVYLTPTSGNFYNAAMVIVPVLEELGLNIELMTVDSSAHGAIRTAMEEYDIGCWEVQQNTENPVLHGTFVTGTQGKWRTERRNDAVARMQASPTGSPESLAAYNDYLDAVIDECPYILFGHPKGLSYHWPNVQGISNTENGLYNGQVAYYWNCYFTD